MTPHSTSQSGPGGEAGQAYNYTVYLDFPIKLCQHTLPIGTLTSLLGAALTISVSELTAENPDFATFSTPTLCTRHPLT
jgi:hypothetical protein